MRTNGADVGVCHLRWTEAIAEHQNKANNKNSKEETANFWTESCQSAVQKLYKNKLQLKKPQCFAR